jgi:hypothetical protein
MDAHKFEVIFREGRGGHQQTQLDAIPCQAGFRLFLKTGSYSRPDPKSLKFFRVNATAGL